MGLTEKQRAYHRRWNRNQSPEYKARKLRIQKERLIKIKDFIYKVKTDSGCMDCGESDPVVLDFDHRPGTDKEGNIGSYRSLGWSIERLTKEIKKCDVVCANCHRRRTYNRKIAE